MVHLNMYSSRTDDRIIVSRESLCGEYPNVSRLLAKSGVICYLGSRPQCSIVILLRYRLIAQ